MRYESEYKWYEKLTYYCSLVYVWLFFKLRLRGPANHIQRWIAGELKAPQKPIPFDSFLSPEGVIFFTQKKFQYRKDGTNIQIPLLTSRTGRRWWLPLDYISKPEVFYWRLLSATMKDGDCDDRHYFSGYCVTKLTEPVIRKVHLAHVWFRGGGHTLMMFERGGQWYYDDYGLKRLDDEHELPYIIAKKYSGSHVVTMYCREEIRRPWKLYSVGLKEPK